MTWNCLVWRKVEPCSFWRLDRFHTHTRWFETIGLDFTHTHKMTQGSSSELLWLTSHPHSSTSSLPLSVVVSKDRLTGCWSPRLGLSSGYWVLSPGSSVVGVGTKVLSLGYLVPGYPGICLCPEPWAISCGFWVPSPQSWVLGTGLPRYLSWVISRGYWVASPQSWVLGTGLPRYLCPGSWVISRGSLVLSPGCLVVGYPGICLSVSLFTCC